VKERTINNAMPRNPAEFVRFLSEHYRIVAAMCGERQRFSNDEEIAAFIRRFSERDVNPAWRIGRIKEIGILTCGTSDWSVPAYLVQFFRELQNLYALATPEIVRASVGAMDKLVRDLEKRAEGFERGPEFAEEDDTVFLLEQIQDALHAIIYNVEGNCDRITVEVNEFRKMEEVNSFDSKADGDIVAFGPDRRRPRRGARSQRHNTVVTRQVWNHATRRGVRALGASYFPAARRDIPS